MHEKFKKSMSRLLLKRTQKQFKKTHFDTKYCNLILVMKFVICVNNFYIGHFFVFPRLIRCQYVLFKSIISRL